MLIATFWKLGFKILLAVFHFEVSIGSVFKNVTVWDSSNVESISWVTAMEVFTIIQYILRSK